MARPAGWRVPGAAGLLLARGDISARRAMVRARELSAVSPLAGLSPLLPLVALPVARGLVGAPLSWRPRALSPRALRGVPLDSSGGSSFETRALPLRLAPGLSSSSAAGR